MGETWMQLENLDVPIVCIKQFELDEAEIVWDTLKLM